MQAKLIPALIPLLAISLYAQADFDGLIRQGRDAFLASDPERAAKAYNQACPDDTAANYPVARQVTCENLLASVDEVRGNLLRAEQRYVHAVTVAYQAGPAYLPLYCAKLIDLGEFYRRQARRPEAGGALEKAVDLGRTLSTTQPELLPEALTRLAALYADSTRPSGGRALLSEALPLMAHSPDKEVALAYNTLGTIEIASGNYVAAERDLRKSLELATRSLGEDHAVTAAYETNLALAMILQQRFSDAELLLRRAEFVVQSHAATPDKEMAVICEEMSEALGSQGKLTRAADYAKRAVLILSAQIHPDARSLAIAQTALAGIYLRSHDLVGADAILPAAVETQRAAALNPNTVAASLRMLGDLRSQQHNWTQAEASYREAIALYKRNGSANPSIGPVLLGLADVLKHEGGSKEARRTLDSEVRSLRDEARGMMQPAAAAAPPA